MSNVPPNPTPNNSFSNIENVGKNQWLLERQLNWISNGDVKIGAIVTLNLALLAGLAKYFSNDGPVLLDLLYVGTAISIITGLVLCKMGFKPRFDAPNQSNIFFGTIIKKDLSRFSTEINQLTQDDFNSDLAEQIHRNAQIACIKYTYLSKATSTLLITSFLWTITLGITLFTNKYEITEQNQIPSKNNLSQLSK